MREIKFRGLSKGKWVYGFYAHKPYGDIEQHFIIDWRINTADSMPDTYFYDAPVNPETVGQYTGLKDKNGKEIYEGDILTVHCGTFKVCWNDEHCGFYMYYFPDEELDGDMYDMAEFWPDSVIIGNIHENPELLQEDEQ